MISFKCSLCGLIKSQRAASNVSKYCRGCWNEYQRMRSKARRNGSNLTIIGYRAWRQQQGLPIAQDVVKGRPVEIARENRLTIFTCAGCGIVRMQRHSGFKICIACFREFGRWEDVFPNLTIPIYLGLRAGGELQKPPQGVDRIVPDHIRAFVLGLDETMLKALQDSYT